MRRRVAVLILTVAVIPALSATPAADATYRGRPGRLAYASAEAPADQNQHSVADIYTRKYNGAGIRRLTKTRRFSDRDPSWSPDGTEIVWSCHGHWTDVDPFYVADICTMDADGSDKVRFGFDTSVLMPEFSPDGSQIAYLTDGPVQDAPAQPTDELWVMDRDGSNRRQVTTNTFSETALSWSPAGDEIAFVSWDARAGVGQLHVVNVATGAERMIATDVEGRRHYHGLSASYVDWAPHGESIVFLRSPDGDDSVDLFLFDLKDLTEQQLTDEGGEYNLGPAWSPDGTSIVYRHASEGTHPEWGSAHFCRLTLPISEPRRTHHPTHCPLHRVVEQDYSWQAKES